MLFEIEQSFQTAEFERMDLSPASQDRTNIVSHDYLSANHQLVWFLRIYSEVDEVVHAELLEVLVESAPVIGKGCNGVKAHGTQFERIRYVAACAFPAIVEAVIAISEMEIEGLVCCLC